MSNGETFKKPSATPSDVWSAARANDVERVKSLIGAGVDIDARDHRGHSALMVAAYGGHREVFDYLIEQGADPNAADHGGNSALMGAAFKGHLDIVQRLLALGVDARVVNHSGLDAARYAQLFGREAVADFLAHRAQEAGATGREED